MNINCYKSPPKEADVSSSQLHPDDQALLDWKGSMGDTAAEQLKQRQDRARAADRLTLAGGDAKKLLLRDYNTTAGPSTKEKKAFSRVLDETMQSWMKKTTYLVNDYSRKVHDFKSLAQTKQDIVQDLATKQKEIAKRRSALAISASFANDNYDPSKLQHPTKSNLKAVSVMSVFPDFDHWGYAYTHTVMDKAPKRPSSSDDEEDVANKLGRALVANVEKRQANARMTCQVLVPDEEDDDEYVPLTRYDLDVVPLKDEDGPHVNFCLWANPTAGTATYLPLSSRVQLSTGRPVVDGANRRVARRERDAEDVEEMDERLAEINGEAVQRRKEAIEQTGGNEKDDSAAVDDGLNDEMDDDDDDEEF